MLSIRYLCSLIAGAAVSLGLLVVASDLTTPAEAVTADDPMVFAVFGQAGQSMPASPAMAQVWDDGVQLPGGAYAERPAVAKPAAVVVTRTIYYRSSDTWWTRGPVRRVVSWPFRRILGRARCR